MLKALNYPCLENGMVETSLHGYMISGDINADELMYARHGKSENIHALDLLRRASFVMFARRCCSYF